jgi:hypothetical protein
VSTIVSIELHQAYPYKPVFMAAGLMEFFTGLFTWMDKTRITPEHLERFQIDVFWADGEADQYLDVINFISAAYHALCEWHDGKQGYVLLCLLGKYYHPGHGMGVMEEIRWELKIFEQHFENHGSY